ncbi:MAG: transposase [Paraglaciecola sp.]
MRSEQATKREHHTLNSRMLKQAEGSRKTFKKLCQQAFACRTDALAPVEQWQEKQATLAVEATVLDVPVYEGKGRPGKNTYPVRTYYEISGNLYTPLEKRDEATKQLSLSILATNDIGMLRPYKSQQAVEKGIRKYTLFCRHRHRHRNPLTNYPQSMLINCGLQSFTSFMVVSLLFIHTYILH